MPCVLRGCVFRPDISLDCLVLTSCSVSPQVLSAVGTCASFRQFPSLRADQYVAPRSCAVRLSPTSGARMLIHSKLKG